MNNIIYLTNSSWLVFGKCFNMLISFLISIQVSKYLGPSDFGIMHYAISIALIFSIFSVLGLDNLLVRELAGNPKKHNKLLLNAYILRIMGSLIGIIILIIYLTQANVSEEVFILTLICSISFIFNSTDVLKSHFESKIEARKIVIAESTAILISAGLKIYFITIKYSVIAFVFCWLLEWFIISLILILTFFYRKNIHIKNFKPDPDIIINLFNKSYPLLISAITIVIYQNIDKIMIKNIMGDLGNAQIGYYSIASIFLAFVIIIPQMLGKSIIPNLIKEHDISNNSFSKKFQLFMDAMVWISIILSIILFSFSELFIKYLYDDSYLASIPLLKLISWKGIFIILASVSGYWIIIKNLQKLAVIRNIFGCFINILLNYLWIPKWGALGSAAATLISFSISSFFIHFFIPSFKPIFMIQCNSLLFGPFRLIKFIKKN